LCFCRQSDQVAKDQKYQVLFLSTPFQGDATTNAGFSNGKPWLKVNPDNRTINVATQEADPNSCLNYFRRLLKLRKENKILVYGRYTLLDKDNPKVYAYSRTWEGDTLLILLNFTQEISVADTGFDLGKAVPIIGNYAEPSKNGIMKPYEAAIYQLLN